MTPELLVIWAGYAAQTILVIALLVATLRVLAGPTLADRVLGLDLMVAIAIGFIGVTSILTRHTLYIDIALALALVGFLATIAFARYILSQADKNGQGPIAWPKGLIRPDKTSDKSKSVDTAKTNLTGPESLGIGGPAKGGKVKPSGIGAPSKKSAGNPDKGPKKSSSGRKKS